ncbi:sorting nexin 2B [Dorcoceras hygrometricum]|uniref:Sorting nexin 2B n=1 Tax=Dorcoceras hygrometricum TaxID=472368 RepID=A0A2Z7CC97_9LAMI|nr:sorting nexin 2B [Dorcoceras hygrometricum]
MYAGSIDVHPLLMEGSNCSLRAIKDESVRSRAGSNQLEDHKFQEAREVFGDVEDEEDNCAVNDESAVSRWMQAG